MKTYKRIEGSSELMVVNRRTGEKFCVEQLEPEGEVKNQELVKIAAYIRHEMYNIEYAIGHNGMGTEGLKSLWNELSNIVTKLDSIKLPPQQPSEEEMLIAFKDWYNSDERNEYHLSIGEIRRFLEQRNY